MKYGSYDKTVTWYFTI